MKTKIFRSIFSLLLVTLLLCLFAGCGIVNFPPNETVAPTLPSDQPKADLRIVLSSDIHCTHLNTWYSVGNNARMQHWVDSILKEHEENPIDLLVINGDISLDFRLVGGSVINEGKSTSKIFVDDYLSQLPDDLPVFIIPGNHEQYSDEDWFDITGNHRSGYMEMDGNLFIFLDTYSGDLSPTTHHNGVYSGVDVDSVKTLMDEYPNDNVYLIAHHFEVDTESSQFKTLVKENDRIIGLFSGHTHDASLVKLGKGWGNKVLAQTGNFSRYAGDYKESFWGFRELIITNDNAYSQYIIMDSEAVLDGITMEFKYAICGQICYYGTAPELPVNPNLQLK